VKIEAGGALVAGAELRQLLDIGLRKHAAFLFEPPAQLRMGQRKQEADHADGDRSRFDKICHSGGDTVLLAVEADDETACTKIPAR